MVIQYKKKILYFNLFFGLLWLLLYFLDVYFVENNEWYHYISLVLSAAYICLFLYHIKYKYICIKNGILTVNGPSGKSISLNSIYRIKNFAGDYIIYSDLKSYNKSITIYTQNKTHDAQIRLKEELEKTNSEWI